MSFHFTAVVTVRSDFFFFFFLSFPGGAESKESACNPGELASRSPGERSG